MMNATNPLVITLLFSCALGLQACDAKCVARKNTVGAAKRPSASASAAAALASQVSTPPTAADARGVAGGAVTSPDSNDASSTTLVVNAPSAAPSSRPPPDLTVAPEVFTQLTQVVVDWRGTLSGWGKRLTFPTESKPEKLLDGQGGSMRLLAVAPTTLWVERRWDGGGVDVHHFESSPLPEGWRLFFVDNVTQIFAEDPTLSGHWDGLSLAKRHEGFVERFLEAWPVNVKEGVAFRPLSDELFPVVVLGNSKRAPSLWAALDEHCPVDSKASQQKNGNIAKGALRGSGSLPTERRCLLLGDAPRVNKALMRHAGPSRDWALSTWMDPH